jgi:arabinose-5-phosphate isomerase
MLVEAEAIRQCVQNLQPAQVDQAIRLLMECQGKIIVLGVGKSGIVGHKIAATLSSTGTPAIYLHASDAVHGDLGIVHRNDVVIAISNSGETEEVVLLLPHLSLRSVPIIAIVGNPESTLAKGARVVLNASIDREACPLNLAPTTSTSVALAVGDALAMTLMQAKQITAEDFAINHPAGKLGKRLALKVKDLMHTGDKNPVISPVAPLSEVVEAISRWRLGAISVIDEKQSLIGIITDGDLRRALQKFPAQTFEQLSAEKIMTTNPVSAQPTMLAYEALQVMEKRSSQISVLPVVESGGKVVGLIHIHDILGKL